MLGGEAWPFIRVSTEGHLHVFLNLKVFGLLPLTTLEAGHVTPLPGLASFRLSMESSGKRPGASSRELEQEPGAWQGC